MAAFTPVGVEFVARGMRQFETRINHVNDGILDLTDSIDKLGKEVAETATKDFNALQSSILDTQDSVRAMGQAMGQQAGGGGGIGQLLDNVANLGSVIGGIGSVVGGAISAVVDLGRAMIGAAIDGAQFLAQKLIGVIASSTEMATSFESATNVLGIAASAEIQRGVTSFEELSDASLAVGADTGLIGVSAMQAADAITGLYKAGLTTEQIFGDLQGYLKGDTELFGALRASIDLAAASELDMVEASELATTLMFTFGKEAEELGMTVDEWVVGAMNNMVQAADASVTSVPELSAALSNAGPILSSYGFTLSDVNTALAVMSQQGIRGAEAGTALRSMFSVMTGGGKKAEKAMKELGVSLYDQQGNMFSLGEIVLQFANQMGGTRDVMVEVGGRTKEQNVELKRLRSMYAGAEQDLRDYELGISGVGQTEEARQKSIEQLRIKMVNLGAAIGDLEAIQGTASKRTVAWTQQEIDIRTKNIAGPYGKTALVALLAGEAEGWENMATAVGDAATIQEVSAKKAESLAAKQEALEGVMETLAITIGDPFRELKKEFLTAALPIIETYGPKLADMLAGIGESLRAVGDVVFALDWDAIVGDLLSGDFSALIEGLSFAGLELGIPEGALNFVLDLIEKGGELAIWLRDTIPSAIATASTYWTDTLWPAMQDVWDWVQGTAIPIIRNIHGWLQDQIPSAVQQAASLWETTLQPAIATVIGVFEDLVVFWDTHGPGIQETASNLFAKFSEVTTDLSENVIPWLVEQFGKVSDWFVENGPLIEEAIATAGESWSALSDSVVEVWDIIEPILTDIVDAVLGIVEFGMNIAVGDWEGAWESLQETATSIGNGIVESVEEFFDLIVKALGGESWDAVKEQWAGNWELFETIVSELWTQIVDAVGEWLVKAGAKIEEWATGIQTFWEDLWTGVKDKATEIWEDIATFFSDTWTGIKDKATEIWEGITAFFSDLWTGIQDTATEIWGDVTAFFSDTWTGIQDTATEIWEGITTFLSDTWTDTQDEVTGIWEDITTSLSDLWTGIQDKASEIWEDIKATISDAIQGLFEAMGIDLDEMKERWSAIWEDIKAIAAEVWDRIVAAVTERLTIIQDKATEIWEGIESAAAEAWERITSAITERLTFMRDRAAEIWDEIVIWVAEKAQEIYDGVTKEIQKLEDWWTETWDTISEKATEIWEDIVDWVKGQVKAVYDAVTEEIQKTSDWWDTTWNTISTTATEIWEAIVTWITDQVQAIYDAVTETIQDVADWWANIWDAISTKATEIWEDIVTWVTDQAQAIYDNVTKIIQEVSDWWGEIWGAIVTTTTEETQSIFDTVSGTIEEIKTWLGEQWESMVKLGGDIISGLVEGILGGAGKLVEALTKGVEEAVTAVKDFLGIESPSELFAGFGEAMTTGLVEGLEEGTPALVQQQGDLVRDMTAAMSEELAKASKELEGSMEGIQELLEDDLGPAFADLAEMLEDEAVPVVEDLLELFEDDLTEAIEVASTALDRDFVDAGEAVYRWIRTSFMPTLEDLIDMFRIGLVQAAQIVASSWTGTLIPALNYLAQTLESGARAQVDLLAQAFGDLAGSSQTTAGAFDSLASSTVGVTTGFGNVYTASSDVYGTTGPLIQRLDNLAGMFDKLRDAIKRVNDQLGILIGRLSALPPELPPYLQTGSMSPFEAAVRGIADAVHQLAWEELPALVGILASPVLQGGLRATMTAMSAAPAAIAASPVYPSRNLSVGPVTIQNGMDEARFMALFRRAIRSELGGI